MFYLQLPLTHYDWLDEYFALGLKNGINFYGWYAENDYYEKYWTLAKMNSRHNHASFQSVDEIKKSISKIEYFGQKFSYVFNTTHILSDLSWVYHHLDIINNKIKPKSIIASDIWFFPLIDSKIDINLSSFAWVNNTYTLDYYLKTFRNIKRVIFQRDIILNDLNTFQNTFPYLEYEIFIKNMWCYHNWHCSSYHKEKSKLLCLREKAIKNPKWLIDTEKLRRLQSTKLDCKICSLYQLKDIYLYNTNNSLYLKIPWREFSIDKVSKDAKFTDLAIENCKSSKNSKEFIAKNIKNHRIIFGKYCDYKNCEYYQLENRKWNI